MHVFTYGSLLDPESLRSTLPRVDIGACIPARASGFTRVFDVAFPNDGSQGDKAYFLPGGARPPAVLMCNLRHAPRGSVNGVLIPVDDEALNLLRARELRYDVVDLSHAVTPYPGSWGNLAGVLGFVGKPEFLGTDGVAARTYIDTIHRGAAHWDAHVDGFLPELLASTQMPEQIVDLERVDRRHP